MSARERIVQAARLLDVVGSTYPGPRLPCGQHFALGCALVCAARARCYDSSCCGPALWRELTAQGHPGVVPEVIFEAITLPAVSALVVWGDDDIPF